MIEGLRERVLDNEAGEPDEMSLEASVPTDRASGSRRTLYILIGLVMLIAASVGGIWLFNEIELQKPLQRVIVSDPRNAVVTVNVHFDGWVNTKSVVFDLTRLDGKASSLDVFRVLNQYAQAQKDHLFGRVILAAYGRKKFMIPGDYFQTLGREYATQNPVYTVRTFSHHLVSLDGRQPFPELNGGWIWVMGQELEQFKSFHQRWYLDDFIARQKTNG